MHEEVVFSGAESALLLRLMQRQIGATWVPNKSLPYGCLDRDNGPRFSNDLILTGMRVQDMARGSSNQDLQGADLQTFNAVRLEFPIQFAARTQSHRPYYAISACQMHQVQKMLPKFGILYQRSTHAHGVSLTSAK